VNRKVEFDEYSMWVQKKEDYDWYDWCIFVAEDEETISAIDAIKYTLHPSFPDPIRIVKNRSNCFALFSSGWGGFSLGISVIFNDGSKQETSFFLKLLNNWPRKNSPARFGDDDEKLVYNALLDEKYRWRKHSTILSRTGLPQARVENVLSQLEIDNFARKAYFKSIDNQELWGATSVVGIAPKFVTSKRRPSDV
jgi:transcription initiation factor IIF auxiliary subunit